MQKITKTCLMMAVTMLALSACEFTVKGEVEVPPTSYPTSVDPIASYDCSERKIVRVERIDDWDCSTPGEMEDATAAIDEIDVGAIRITVKRLWDGTFPKLSQLEYRNSDNGLPIRTLACDLLPSSDASPNTRTFECFLHGHAGDPSFYDRFKFHRMTLENEFCEARSVYQSQMPDASCYRDSYYVDREFRFDVYLNGEKLPVLFPTDI